MFLKFNVFLFKFLHMVLSHKQMYTMDILHRKRVLLLLFCIWFLDVSQKDVTNLSQAVTV